MTMGQFIDLTAKDGFTFPAYVAEPGYGAECFVQRQRFWDGYGWRVRNVRVCD